ncbi:MAG: hypothetical protein WAN46_04505, partial [Gammaproteobacteria bacterium]
MTEQYYDVIVTGMRSSVDLSNVKQQLATVFKTEAKKFDFLHDMHILNRDVTFRKQLSHSAAEKLKWILEQNGLKCELQPSWQLVEIEKEIEMYTCPACGHEQEKARDDSDVCAQCGVIAAKYAKTLERNQLIASEKRQYEIRQKLQAQLEKEAAERTAQQEELRKIRKRFGWENSSRRKALTMSSLVGISLVATGILAYALQDGKSDERALEMASVEQITASAVGDFPPVSEPVATTFSGVIPQAIETPGSTSDDIVAAERAAQLDQLAQDQAAQGNHTAAQETFQTALKATADIEDSTHRENALSDISQHQAQSGDMSGALQTADQIKDLRARGQTLSAIATDRSRAADKEGSEKAFERLIETSNHINGETANNINGDEPFDRAHMLQFICDYALQSNDIYQALEVSAEIDEPFRRAEMLTKIAEKQLQLEDVVGAQETITAIEDVLDGLQNEEERAVVLSSIGGLFATVGDEERSKQAFSRAIESADLIQSRSKRATVMSAIAKDHYIAGHRNLARQIFARATTLAGTIKVDTDSRDEALRSITRDQASIFEFAGAVKTAAQTESSYARAIALKDIAQAQMRAGDRVSAKANFSQALNASRE